jgi:hypothetical protein
VIVAVALVVCVVLGALLFVGGVIVWRDVISGNGPFR